MRHAPIWDYWLRDTKEAVTRARREQAENDEAFRQAAARRRHA